MADMPRQTRLYEKHVAAGARMIRFGGWEMPQQYTSVRDEHLAVRTAAGLFDVSHMGRFEIRGSGAGDFLQWLVTNDLSTLRSGQAQYNLLCRPDGGIVDDLVVYRGSETWMVVVNAANREKDLAWLRQHAPASVEILDRSDELGLLALQGPRAEALLAAGGVDLSSLPYFGIAQAAVASTPMTISRTGYTGEDGFELFVPAEELPRVWDTLVEAGARPCGLAARDVCRLEAGLRLYGADMDERTNPYEVGLGWTVKLEKGEFVGREEFQRVKAQGPKLTMVGLGCSGRTIPRHGAAVSRDGRLVGTVTSGTYSFWLQKGIGMALIERGVAPRGTQVAIETRGGEGQAEVIALPFYRGSVRQASRM